jgi:hypothetical protein
MLALNVGDLGYSVRLGGLKTLRCDELSKPREKFSSLPIFDIPQPSLLSDIMAA